MKLIAHRLAPDAPPIRPAPPTREWMDESPQRFAYRCLPLGIANSHGWEVLCTSSFEASWNGGGSPDSVTVTPLEGASNLPHGHFGGGTLTFHLNYLFQTPPGYDLLVTGPINQPKDGAAPLTGVVETHWLPFPFTMNWAFTQPEMPVRWERGEPFCHFFPVPSGLLESVEPEIRDIDADPELFARYEQWLISRHDFLKALPIEGTDAHAQGWQRNYLRGRHPDQAPGSDRHRTRLNLKGFEDG